MVFNVHLMEMAGGNDKDNSSNDNDIENDDDKGSNTSFANARNDSERVIPNLNLNTCSKHLEIESEFSCKNMTRDELGLSHEKVPNQIPRD